MKRCTKCKKDKDFSDFHVFKNSKDGYYTHCKKCKKKYDKEYRKSNKIQSLYKSKKYRDRKKEYRKFRDKDPRIQLLISAKARAKKNNLPFNITLEDIVIPKYCPILNIRLKRKPYGQRGSFISCSPSIDKIIPKLGYVKGNIMIISMKANVMKCNASLSELITFSKNILKLFNKK